MLWRRWSMCQMLTCCDEITEMGGAGQLANCLGGYLSGEWVIPAAPAVPPQILVLICSTGRMPEPLHQNSSLFFILWQSYISYIPFFLPARAWLSHSMPVAAHLHFPISLGRVRSFVLRLGSFLFYSFNLVLEIPTKMWDGTWTSS
jgi:hypothetical protein